MTGPEAIAGVRTLEISPLSADVRTPVAGGPQSGAPLDFGRLVASGISQVEAKVTEANNMVGRFALDDSIPVHQVTMALEEARLAVELAVQIRSRFVEGYREIMNMQL